MENVDLGARNNLLKFPTQTLCFTFCVTFTPLHENRFFAYILINMSPRGKLQDTPNIPHKISYMIASLKVSLGLLVRRKTMLEITNFIIFTNIVWSKMTRNCHCIREEKLQKNCCQRHFVAQSILEQC